MAEPEVEAAWRAEFKRIGETQVRDVLNSITDETKRQAAFRWLGDEAEARRLREEQTHRRTVRNLTGAATVDDEAPPIQLGDRPRAQLMAVEARRAAQKPHPDFQGMAWLNKGLTAENIRPPR
jgi:hypothetical protein